MRKLRDNDPSLLSARLGFASNRIRFAVDLRQLEIWHNQLPFSSFLPLPASKGRSEGLSESIRQRLLGESLYRDLCHCIREPMQDALEHRGLRLKTKQKGWVRHSSFGFQGRSPARGFDNETGQQWLRVTKDSADMTNDAIKNYVTQVGMSYYCSSEFNQELVPTMVRSTRVGPTETSKVNYVLLACLSDVHIL